MTPLGRAVISGAMTSLPIDSVLPDIARALAGSSGLVLQAPPGAGKTTKVPLALLGADWLSGQRIIMLEPRRLAARAAAARMAETLGEPVGQRVGYRIRFEAKVSAATRIEVVTEGILTRMLQDDPSLPGVGLVIFDEFHERSLNADLGLALCLEAQTALRDDLKLLVMSATLDGGPVAKLMSGVPVVTSEGRAFPIETRFLARPEPRRFADAVTHAVAQALREEEGDVLVFLPGAGEIRRVESLLAEHPAARGVTLAPLYGDLAQDAQDRAIRRAGEGRKVVLATAIAETSLTIDGVRVVVDGGQMRQPRFDPSSGMTRLVTLPVSRASADQRRGRAGRTAPGVCYRLWSEAEDRALQPFTPPEIMEADLAPLALDLAQWGVGDASELAWLDAPPAATLAQARELLGELGAVDGQGRMTAHGRAMNRLSMHPRLAHMVLKARDLGLGGLACDLAALLGERDIVRAERGFRDSDLRLRLDALRDGFAAHHGLSVDRGGVARARQAAKDWRRRIGLKPGEENGEVRDAGLLLAFAYPDRIARRRPGGEPRYALSGGSGAFFADPEPLSAEEWLVAAELDGDRREARIFLAAPLAKAEIEEHFADSIRTEASVAWDRRDEVVHARRQRRLFNLVLDEVKLDKVPPDQLAAAMAEGIRVMGLACLPWTDELMKFRERVAFLRKVDGEAWPDLSDQALLEGLEEWLAPYLAGITRRAHLQRLDLSQAVRGMLDWEASRKLDDLAPTHVTVPSGSRVPIDYSGETPVLAVRLQEMFACADTPRIAAGKVPLLLHLLSPARRPVQVTQDLASFWANAYKAVKADLKGQYPKHWWPDDPMQAEPTARAKPRK